MVFGIRRLTAAHFSHALDAAAGATSMTGHLLGKGDAHAKADDERYRAACAPDAPACFAIYRESLPPICGRCGKAWQPGGCGMTVAECADGTLRTRVAEPLQIAAE